MHLLLQLKWNLYVQYAHLQRVKKTIMTVTF